MLSPGMRWADIEPSCKVARYGPGIRWAVSTCIFAAPRTLLDLYSITLAINSHGVTLSDGNIVQRLSTQRHKVTPVGLGLLG